MMEYKGYAAKVEFDDEAGLFHGQVLNIRDVITFQGQSVTELREEFQNSVEDYLEFCATRGEEPEKPFSGRFLVRIDPGLHRAAAGAAARAGLSLNAWVAGLIERDTASAFPNITSGDCDPIHASSVPTRTPRRSKLVEVDA